MSLPVSLILSLITALLLQQASSASLLSLPSPVRCEIGHSVCILSNHQGTWTDRTPCRAARVVFPATEAELVSAVAEAVKEGTRMKVVTEIGHSVSKIACPEGENGLLISMRDYTPDPVFVNKTEMSAYVDAGFQLREFVNALAQDGVTIPHTPLWDGVSMGGAIATGSHGSGFFSRGSTISEYVSAVRMVVPAPPELGYAKVITLHREDEALNAAKLSLGVLGVVSKITFSVLPMFKRSLTLMLATDADFDDRVIPFSREYDFASLFWIPSAGKVLYKEENAVSIEEEGDGVNKFPLVQPMLASKIMAMRAHQDSVERAKDAASLCKAGGDMVEHRLRTADGYVNSDVHGAFHGFPVVGFNHRMQCTGGCQLYKPLAPSELHADKSSADTDESSTPRADVYASDWWTCKWDPRINGVFYHHTAVAIPFANVADFIKDVKKLREAKPEGMCVLNMFGGIHVRFVAKSDADLGDKVDSAVFELVYYRSKDPIEGRLHQDVVEEIEQMMVIKYKGRPHWGKNRNVAFQRAWQKVSNLEEFLRVKEQLDPDGLFSSTWSDELLGLHETSSKVDYDHCALDGMCLCREDRHCSPSTGYTCQQGLVFKDARVCRYTLSDPMS